MSPNAGEGLGQVRLHGMKESAIERLQNVAGMCHDLNHHNVALLKKLEVISTLVALVAIQPQNCCAIGLPHLLALPFDIREKDLTIFSEQEQGAHVSDPT